MSVFSKDAGDSPDLEFMDDVEAAFRRRGNIWAYRFSAILLVFFAAFLLWTMFATREEITRGNGQIIPSMGVQPIQSSHGGRIKKINVRENQEVQAGEQLVLMSNIDAEVQHQDLLNKEIDCELALKRLEAEANSTQLVYTPEEESLYPEAVQGQMRLFNSRREKYEGGGRELAATLQEKEQGVQEGLARKRQFETNLLLLREQEARVRPLVARGAYSPIEHLSMKQRIVAQEGELKGLAESISRTLSQVEEVKNQLRTRQAEWENAIAMEEHEYRRQRDSIRQKLQAARRQVEDSVLTAPVTGVIKRIVLKENNVAQPAQVIMELLPTEDTLEVDARFRPQDRAYLEEGMPAVIKVAAYDFTIYGGLDATVMSISPDTIEDNKGQAWYEVRLRTNTNRLMVDGQELDLKAGMTVAADVISGEKKVFDYLMKPILKSRIKGNVRGHEVNGTGNGTMGTDAERKGMPDKEILPEQGAPAGGAS